MIIMVMGYLIVTHFQGSSEAPLDRELPQEEQDLSFVTSSVINLVILSKSLYSSVPQFPHLNNGCIDAYCLCKINQGLCEKCYVELDITTAIILLQNFKTTSVICYWAINNYLQQTSQFGPQSLRKIIDVLDSYYDITFFLNFCLFK